jgi:hypothetical protein
MSGPNQSIEVPFYYATLSDVSVAAGVITVHDVAGVSRPARRAVVGSIGAAGLTLTRIDGTTVVMSAAQLLKLGGIVERQFIALQSNDSTDVGVDY